ncbi:MAG: tetratricopeptide repeat protein [Acidobacteria bacterium]|nr:tetratricopeptide repeat protein [Acidobacteriota bacterium]
MKKALTTLLILVLLLAALPASARLSVRANEKAYLETRRSEAETVAAPTGEANFRVVDLQIDEEALDGLSVREKKEQLLDWLFFAALNESLTDKQLNEVSYDLPTIRKGYMHQAANFEYGETRSRYIGNGKVIALLPAAIAPEYLDRLAHVADEQRKNIGAIPTAILAYQYRVNPKTLTAMLSSPETVETRSLFTAERGYVEARITNLQELRDFLGRINDLTFASKKTGVLTLGGRKMMGGVYQGINLEDVAAIWQSEKTISEKQAAFNARWDEKYRAFLEMKKLETYALVTQQDVERFKRELEKEKQELVAQMYDEQHKLGLVKESGFSLDPSYDYKKLATFFDTGIMPIVKEALKVAPGGITNQEITAVKEGLAKRDDDPLYRLLGKLSKLLGEDVAQDIQTLILEKYSFQKARYDGELQGTHVGMVLFYTDLIAKLWGWDFADSTPHTIKDFIAKTDRTFAGIHLQELRKVPNTRLWFGADKDRGFQVLDNGTKLCFARRATRIFSASSNPFEPGIEKETNFISGDFIAWWDKHFEEVAQYEPEYQSLNEIMKWSLLIGWLNEANNGDLLGFLRNVPVNRSFWFPDWVQQNAQLKYQKWESVGFFPRGYNGEKTEALPTLKSKHYSPTGSVIRLYYFSGGVSLGGKEIFKGRAARSIVAEAHPTVIRPNVESVVVKPTGKAITTSEGAVYRIKNTPPHQPLAITVTPKAQAKLRSNNAELSNRPTFERLYSRQPETARFAVRANGTEIGSLDISSNAAAKNRLSIGVKSRDIDAGHAFARRLSKALEPDRMLYRDPDVEVAYKLVNQEEYLVKLKTSDKWMKVALTPPEKELPAGWQGRVADASNNSYNVNINWVDKAAAQAELAKGGIIRMQSVSSATETAASGIAARLPADGTMPLEIINGKTVIKGVYEPKTQTVYFNKLTLPPEMKADPARLGKVLNNSDMFEIQRLAKQSPLTIRYEAGTLPKPTPAQERLARIDGYLEVERPGKAIKEIDALLQTQGEQPELLMRKAVARIEQERLEEAAKILDRIPKPDQEAFYKAVNERLAQSYDKADVSSRFVPPKPAIKPSGAGYELELRGGVIPDVDSLLINTLPEAERANMKEIMNLRLRGGIEAESVVNPQALLDGRARFYIEDAPGLNNLDWNASLKNALHQVVAEDLGTVFKLQRGSIARLKPTTILTADGSKRFRASSYSATPRGFKQPQTFNLTGGSFHRDNCDDEADEDCDNERDTVYVVVAKKR